MKHPDNLYSNISGQYLFFLTSFILLVTGLLIYSNIFSNGFHLDDFHTVMFNSHLHSLKNIPSFFLNGSGFSGSHSVRGYRPVTVTLNALNYAISQTRPPLYHLINLTIHLFTAILVSRLAFVLSGIPFVSLLSGLIFLVHPLNTEAVNYISARSSTLSALFYIGSFLAFLEFRKKDNAQWLFLSLFLLIISLLSKEISITFPLVIIAYDAFFSSRLPLSKKFQTGILYLIPVIVYLIVRLEFMSLHSGIPSESSTLVRGSLFFDQMTLVFAGSLFLATHSLLLYFYPHPLIFDRPFPIPQFDRSSVWFLLFWCALFIWILLCQKEKRVPFLVAWFILTLSPLFYLPTVSSLSLFKENRSYLSGTGIVILMALGTYKITHHFQTVISGPFRWLPSILILLVLTLFSLNSYYRNQIWKSEVTLWSDTLEKNPDSFIGTFSLGYGYLTEGQFEKASFYFNQSLKRSPPKEYLYYIHNNLGTVYEYRADEEMALDEYRMAEKLGPRLPEAHLNLGRIYLNRGNYGDAAREMETAIDMDFDHLKQRVDAAIKLERLGASQEAFELFRTLAKVMPDTSEYDLLRNLVNQHETNEKRY
ncbi:MAG: tetratricopeptide repeat protein [Nitrospirae bacterium]|nr:tetratricopeptide repeat protein [Nitrospirota bacterium]